MAAAPDLTAGVTLADFDDQGLLGGQVAGEPVLLARLGDDVVAIGAECTHYGGPLDQGFVEGETVRCPWHHACFSLRTGEAVDAPAIEPVSRWNVERDGDRIVVRERATTVPLPRVDTPSHERPNRVLIIGGGGAGFPCAEMLRRHGFEGSVTMVSGDPDAPYDRPSLSKDYLAGGVSGDDLPMKADTFYPDHDIDLRLNTTITTIDLDQRSVTHSSGATHDFDCLVLATGAEPVELPIPGADQDHVHTLRTVADSDALIAAAEKAENAVLLGSGFIGLEVAASLSQRDVTVHVVTQDQLPLESVLGEALARRVREEHEMHGTTFHLETSISRIDDKTVTLGDGTELDADLVVLGVGVKPRIDLAEAAGLDVDDGVLVDECLQTSVAGVYAVGDIARWHDTHVARTLRVEHWVLAQRHGQHVARNILHGDHPFTDAPFFWSGHHDMKIRYVGHAEDWDDIEIDGDVEMLDCLVRYRKDGQVRAIAAVGRDLEALGWQAALGGADGP